MFRGNETVFIEDSPGFDRNEWLPYRSLWVNRRFFEQGIVAVSTNDASGSIPPPNMISLGLRTLELSMPPTQKTSAATLATLIQTQCGSSNTPDTITKVLRNPKRRDEIFFPIRWDPQR